MEKIAIFFSEDESKEILNWILKAEANMDYNEHIENLVTSLTNLEFNL
jgi:hypothetical protein